MSNVLEDLPSGARVALIRLRSLGDCVLTTPAIHLLKEARPDLAIAVAVEERFAAIFEGNPDISDLMRPSIRDLRRFGPRLCLNLHGGPTSARMTALSGARYRAGFSHFPRRFIYNVRIPRAQEILAVERKVHTAEHVASAIFYLGVPRTAIPRARLFAQPQGGSPAVIHPFASEAAKTWPAASFLNVAKHIRRELDLHPVFIGGPGDDLSLFQAWQVRGNTSLADIKNLIAGAALFVGNDSGPAHMAAACGVPSVVLFGPSDPVVWAPWQAPAEVISGVPIASISERQVIGAIEKMRVHA